MTKSLMTQLLAAVLLMVGAVVLWSRGAEADRLADAERSLVTLQYGRAAETNATAPAADYWSGNYDAVSGDANPLLAANAAYRSAVAPGGSARDMVTRLDEVVKRYADVVRNDPTNEDAAFNYEFAVRYRAAIAARGVPIPPVGDDRTSTPHGRAGAPPKGTSPQQFKMLVPMRPDERKEAEEAGRTGRRIRKG